MAENQMIITSPSSSISRVKRLFGGKKTISWLYLGKDSQKRSCISKKLGNGYRRIDIASLHEQVTNKIKLQHVQWIDELNRKYGDKLEWWFGSVSSRNIVNSNLFQYCCYLEILERLFKDHECPELIVAGSYGLSEAIKKWALKKNMKVSVCGYSQSKIILFFYPILNLLHLSKIAAILFIRWSCANITRIRHGKKQLGLEDYIIVDTFLHDYCLSEDGVFKDRYFPYLHEYLARKGINIVVHAVLHGFRLNYISIYRRMRISDTNFVIPEDYLHLPDYISALTSIFRVLRVKMEVPLFRIFDVSDIVKEEHRRQSFSPVMQAALIYSLFLRLGETGLQVKQVIDWYENQVIDKALIAGIRKAFPNAKIVGAQIFLHPPNHLNLFPCQSEVDERIAPDLLLETSEYQCRVAQAFTNSIPCKSAAALRYAHLYGDETLSIPVANDARKVILVLLPFDLDEAVELLEVLKEGMDSVNEDAIILIKGHPDYSSEDIIKAFGKSYWPSRFEICSQNLNEALEQASLVISSNSSSMVEAAAKGIPIVFIGRQTVFNQNILHSLKLDTVVECFNSNQVIKAINEYIALPSTDMIKNGIMVRNIFFKEINEETMLPFLYFYDKNNPVRKLL